MIEFRDVCLTLNERPVLSDINAELAGPRVGIIGANGSGKTSLLRLINGLASPTSGSVHVLGLQPDRNGRAVRKKVSFLFSNPDAQIVMPTVAEDVAFSLRRHSLSDPERDLRVNQALHQVGLTEHHDHPAHALSSGQKQLLALASIIVTEPQILLCDEPTTLLDRRNTREVINVLNDLPITVVMSTHDLDLIRDWDRVLVVDGGRIIADTTGIEAIATYLKLVDS